MRVEGDLRPGAPAQHTAASVCPFRGGQRIPRAAPGVWSTPWGSLGGATPSGGGGGAGGVSQMRMLVSSDAVISRCESSDLGRGLSGRGVGVGL